VARLRDAGIEIEAVERAAAIEGRQAGDFNVWRPWSGTDGIRAEMEAVAAANRSLTKLVTLGESVQGEPIYAIKVTQNARSVADGSRPSSGYISAQHAREWITVEANRRFMHHLLDNYGSDPEITELLNTTEVWFVLVANPDGYDFTFTDDRLWRKNLADNNNSGTISFFDGVDLNRNFAEKWGYDNEGSSGATSSEVYRGTAPMSEPETQAMDALFALAGFEYFFNIHSAVGIMLYGNGSIVAAESPDDHIGEVLIGTDASPAIPGYNPGVSAELYIVNGDTNDYMQNAYGGFAVVMELETCDQAEALILNDAFGPNFCESEGRSVFEFPDNEALIEMVFQRNLPLYLSGAQSAALGDDPISQDGRRTPDIVLDDYSVAHGTSQMVSADVKRSLGPATLNWQVNGGATQTTPATEWAGGERYGDGFNNFYAEVRGQVTGVVPGDSVLAWFTAGDATSLAFTYNVASAGADVLVVAHEDYNGFSPEQPGVNAPRYAQLHQDALAAAGYSSEVWDVTASGVPDHLGVLAQYDAVLWELGENKITQEASDTSISFFGDAVSEAGVSEVHQYLTIAIRDYLNEGGPLVASGQYTGWFSNNAGFFGGYFYGADGDPTAPCVFTDDIFDCLLHSDDFAQYWLGIDNSQTASGDASVMADGALAPFDAAMVDSDSGQRLTVNADTAQAVTNPELVPAPAARWEGGQVAGVQGTSSVALGFGLEDIASATDRAAVIGSALASLGVQPGVSGGAVCNGLAVTVDLSLGQLPTDGPDVILGTPGDDLIAAAGGDDVVCGGGGNDRIWGQAGNDVLLGEDGDDVLRGGDDADDLFGGNGVDDLGGGRGNDELYGGPGADSKLRGGTGDDVIEGGDGDDVLIAGNGGADVLFGGAGNDQNITGGPRPDVLHGGDGNDVLRGFKGADELFGEGGDDDLRGGPQPDLMDGGAGTDICNGGSTGDGAVEGDTVTGTCESVLNVP